ncbi:conjugation factor E4 [Seminavis robusta]|uniref:RING-type E3 ubiquitin transferase n=1 Tax=Seminavis robusta TaxID=568900 RepID=A0A9N8ETP0_9STRA|nr:conjugation factor E4 [Seminavis robusta]|eukprot:Sro1843_g301160.1 conjugation factor E4 (1106) ;mRNA; f:5981-9496
MDLARWALSGIGGADGEEQQPDQQDQQENEQASAETLSPEEMRAQRLARMEAMQKKQAETAAAAASSSKSEDPKPMEIDEKPAAKSAPEKMDVDVEEKKTSAKSSAAALLPQKEPNKKRKSATTTTADPARKTQKKAEAMLKKVLSVALTGTSTTSDSSCVVINIDDTAISVQTIAEILATRLSLPANAPELRTMPAQKALIPYLAQCHRRAAEELKTMKQSSSKSKSTSTPELMEILEEIKRQVVNYAGSCLMVPELFELGKDAPMQLAKCMTSNVTDLASSITFGVTGPASSFYFLLCEELVSNDEEAFKRVIGEIVAQLTKQLARTENVLDGGDGVTEGSALVMVSALTSVCSHKEAAKVVAQLPNFLLPPEGSDKAKEVVENRPQAGADLMSRLLGLGNRSYLRRSGPALDKETILGLCLRPGIPKINPAFSNVRMSMDSVERTTSSQRRQLRVHQEACNQLVMKLVRAGPGAQGAVMKWFQDALVVNVGATGLRPDPRKVGSISTLMNALVVMLKLCEPFINDEKKQHLINPGYVSCPSTHGGVYATGEDGVPRLGEVDAASMETEYAPKNKFIPQCFFLCARFIHLGYAHQFAPHTSLMRHIQHMHWEAHTNNRNLDSDDTYIRMLTAQRSQEVTLFQEEVVTDSLRFCNLMAKILFEMDDKELRRMPEHFVIDTCDIIMGVARLKPKALRGLEFRYVFKLVVKLLSPTYAGVVRNYNLRATLGDVLYDLFLPSASDERRDVPTSVACDPLAGGQTYLLSDPAAQESLAPSLLLLYGEVEHTGYYDKMTHRAKIASLIKYLWESTEHRPAFRRITQNKQSFIKFANGIMNETNTLIATVMQKLPEIREAQLKMKNTAEWGQLGEEEQNMITGRLDDNEREVKHALPLCNKTLQMFGYLNTDKDIRNLFLLDELCSRLVQMLVHVLTKLVGTKGLDLKVENPEQYDFRPKELLRDLCAIFALFATAKQFQIECAKSGCEPTLLAKAVQTCRKLNLLTGESMTAFEALPDIVAKERQSVEADDELLKDAPEKFLDAMLFTFMKDPVILPSGTIVDRPTITQHLLNDATDPFNRAPMTVEDIKPATELKEEMNKWLEEKRAA